TLCKSVKFQGMKTRSHDDRTAKGNLAGKVKRRAYSCTPLYETVIEDLLDRGCAAFDLDLFAAAERDAVAVRQGDETARRADRFGCTRLQRDFHSAAPLDHDENLRIRILVR